MNNYEQAVPTQAFRLGGILPTMLQRKGGMRMYKNKHSKEGRSEACSRCKGTGYIVGALMLGEKISFQCPKCFGTGKQQKKQ